MGFNTKLSLTCDKFEQCNTDYLYLSGHTYIHSGGTINSNTGYQICGETVLSRGVKFTTSGVTGGNVRNINIPDLNGTVAFISNLASITGNTQTLYTDTMSYRGFVDGSSIDISYNHTNKTITLTGDLSYYWDGVKKSLSSPWTSTGHTATVGHWYLYSTDGTNINWSQSYWLFRHMQVAHVYYRTGITQTFGVRETHGLMDMHAHEDLHSTIGTWLKSGGQATAASYTANTATDAAVSPSFNAAVVDDEDLATTISAWNKASGYTQMYVNGSNSVYTLGATRPFTAGASFIYVNTPSTGAMTAGINNRYYNVYQILVPVTSDVYSQAYRMIFLAPQQTYTTLAAAQAEDTRGLSLGDLTSASAEYIIYSRITYSTANGNANYGKVTIPTNGISYVVGTKMSSMSVAGISSTNHANLSNLDWTSSGHIGTANSLASFDGSGNAESLLKTCFVSSTCFDEFKKLAIAYSIAL